MEHRICPCKDNYCYVCGHVVPKVARKERKNLITNDLKVAYVQYFDETDLFEKDFTPNTVCKNCFDILLKWFNKKDVRFPFAKPMIWFQDPEGHVANRCYACLNFAVGMNKVTLKKKVYIEAFTARLPVPCPVDFVVPKPRSPDRTTGMTAATTSTAVSASTDHARDPDYTPDDEPDDTPHAEAKPTPLTQKEMDFIVARMGLSQRNSEFLTSFLKHRKLTEPNVNATSYRKRQTEFQQYYTVNPENTLSYCHDIPGLNRFNPCILLE